jgi:uncharacterized membrane protein YczE
MKKRIFYTEIAYILGVVALALGTALMERGGFGLSMVVAPAYILHLKISQYLPFFTFGMAEYLFQALLILTMMALLRKAKLSYLLTFGTTVIYGLILDGFIALFGVVPVQSLVVRIIMYGVGIVICSAGVSLMFHTYISPAAYEMFVKEAAPHFHVPIHKLKTAYDCISCVVAVGLSFVFFGLWHFKGIHIGTAVCALVNGTIIHWFSGWFEKHWTFTDGLPARAFWEK